MNIIFIGKFKGRPLRCQIDSTTQALFCFSIMGMLVAGMVYGGYWFGNQHAEFHELAVLDERIKSEKQLIQQAQRDAESNMDALASRVGMMQANVLRLNALGERLLEVADLDVKEFDFSYSPAVGGPHNVEASASVDFDAIIGDLQRQLSSRKQQLELLENILLTKQLLNASRPSGLPIVKGWTSSYYGKRTDPFTGKLAMHKGMDFAGKKGSDIIAVANGVITWASKRYGYGQLVEINHGNGYSTRYGHNDTILVVVGESVIKDQVISTMGSSGRSTGPHVHFEVLKNDRQVNPASYVATNK